jgi:1-deoxy-D-xylulose-5-phosphate reductoisomerase
VSQLQQITVLGATGSIGLSTLDVIARHPGRYQVFALTGFSRLVELEALCMIYRPRYAVVPDERSARHLQGGLHAAGLATRVLIGEQGLCEVAAHPEVDAVMAAIVGAAGLKPTLAAVEAGKKVLLANKEALVMSGALFIEAVRRSGAVLLPIDSEHNAIFQCLPGDYARGLEQVGVRRILLTASGGPFRETPLAQLHEVTPEQACAHPNWSMGRKISVDSASMMNKGLELIEVCWLFDAKPSQVEVVIHPQSVIHSLVDYVDGSVLAQLGNPDMRTPISHALAWPQRIDSGVAPLDLFAIARLDFQAPDEQRFPCLRLAREAAEAGGSVPAMLNAANEVAVAAFLERRIRFPEIASIIEAVLNAESGVAVESVEAVLEADRRARELAGQWLNRRVPPNFRNRRRCV